MANPEAGEVIEGTVGLRKMHFVDKRRGKGKRGGLRVIYYWWDEGLQFWLFTLYDKVVRLRKKAGPVAASFRHVSEDKHKHGKELGIRALKAEHTSSAFDQLGRPLPGHRGKTGSDLMESPNYQSF